MEREELLRQVDELLNQKEVLKAVRLLYGTDWKVEEIRNYVAEKMRVDKGATKVFYIFRDYLPDDQQQYIQERFLKSVEAAPAWRKVEEKPS